MASTILYKFQAGTNFEALPLPGSAARLFDVKKAIVKAKRLDSGSMEFDLAVRNADTNEEYANEGMLLPRGTRLIVQRLPASRGHGLLARIARNEQAGMGLTGRQQQVPGAAPSGFYTIDSSARDDDDEFVQSGGGGGDVVDEDKELAALQAVTNMQSDGPAMTGGYAPGPSRNFVAGSGSGATKPNFAKTPNFRPNADPELRAREQALQPQTKNSRRIGMPRTFISTMKQEDGDNESSMPVLQPNTIGFKELVNRGGGQSENTTGTRRDLDYCLKITSTSVPEHLQCAICNNVVKSPMVLPWDDEGRTTCETCIRDGLTQNGFRCPLTGKDGVSPDELLPNIPLRKAAEMFIKGVMEKFDEIEMQQVEETEVADETNASKDGNILDGDGTEKGVLVSKKSTLANRKKSEDDDPFGGDDDFGGDVFAVEADNTIDEEETNDAEEDEKNAEDNVDQPVTAGENKTENSDKKEVEKDDKGVTEDKGKTVPDSSPTRNEKDLDISADTQSEGGGKESPEKQSRQAETPTQSRNRRRGPPAGYTMGPAGVSRDNAQDNDRFGGGGRGRGGRGGGRYQGYQDRGGFRGGRGHRGRGRGGGNRDFDGGNRGNFQQSFSRDGDDHSQDDDSSRGTKRSWDGHQDGHRDKQHKSRGHDRRDDRYRGDNYEQRNSRNDDSGRGNFRGGFRGGRGRSWGRGGRGRRY